MKKRKNLQHVQVPNNLCLDRSLEMEDRLIYANVKRHMNSEDRISFPSIDTLRRNTGLANSTISAGLGRLKGKYMNWYIKGRQRYYTFPNNCEKFEPFSFKFLDKPDLSPQEKSYLICIQPLMFKNIKGLGKISYTTKELSDLLNISESRIYRYEQTLKEKGYLTTVKTKRVDPKTGVHITERMFNMDMLDQMIIWHLRSGKEVMMSTNEEIAKLRQEQKILKRTIDETMKKNALNKDEIKIVL